MRVILYCTGPCGHGVAVRALLRRREVVFEERDLGAPGVLDDLVGRPAPPVRAAIRGSPVLLLGDEALVGLPAIAERVGALPGREQRSRRER